MPLFLRDDELPEEEPWCEWCGFSYEFCCCIEEVKIEEEGEEDG
jgi:hypothetical protein